MAIPPGLAIPPGWPPSPRAVAPAADDAGRGHFAIDIGPIQDGAAPPAQPLTAAQRWGYAGCAAARDGISCVVGQSVGIATRIGTEKLIDASPWAALVACSFAAGLTALGAAYTTQQLAKQWGWNGYWQAGAALGGGLAASVCPAGLVYAAATAGKAAISHAAAGTPTPTPTPVGGPDHITDVARSLAQLTATGSYSIARQFVQSALTHFLPNVRTDQPWLRVDENGKNNGVALPTGLARAAIGGWIPYSLMRGGSAIVDYYIVDLFQGKNPSLGKLAASLAIQAAPSIVTEMADALFGTLLRLHHMPSAEGVHPSGKLPKGFFKTTAQDALGRAMLNIAAGGVAADSTASLVQEALAGFAAGGATGLRGVLMQALRAKQPEATQSDIESQATDLADVLLPVVEDVLGPEPPPPPPPAQDDGGAAAALVDGRGDGPSPPLFQTHPPAQTTTEFNRHAQQPFPGPDHRRAPPPFDFGSLQKDGIPLAPQHWNPLLTGGMAGHYPHFQVNVNQHVSQQFNQFNQFNAPPSSAPHENNLRAQAKLGTVPLLNISALRQGPPPALFSSRTNADALAQTSRTALPKTNRPNLPPTSRPAPQSSDSSVQVDIARIISWPPR